MRYICCPLLQRLLRTEIPVDDIVSDFAHIAFVRMILFFRAFAFQIKLIHDPLNTLMIYLKSTIQKFLIHPPYAISFFVFIKDIRDFRRQIGISFFDRIGFTNFIVIR